MDPFIVMCAPNGARKSKQDHPALPITPAEIAECAAEVLEAGASILHLHVRDDLNRHSLDADRYRLAIEAVRERVGDQLVIQVTSEACGIYDSAQQMAVIRELQPEAVSLALREICPQPEYKDAAKRFYHELAAAGVMAQYILYSIDDVAKFVSFRDRCVIPAGPAFVLFVLGRYSDDLTGDPAEIQAYTNALGDAAEWAACCFGRTEQEAVKIAASSRGHARVGFENNLLLPDGSTASNNAELVSLAAEARGSRPLATASDVRTYFGN